MFKHTRHVQGRAPRLLEYGFSEFISLNEDTTALISSKLEYC